MVKEGAAKNEATGRAFPLLGARTQCRRDKEGGVAPSPLLRFKGMIIILLPSGIETLDLINSDVPNWKRLSHPNPGIAEYPHPRPVFAPVGWMPGILHRAEATFGVRHHDGESPVFIGKAGNAQRRAVWVEGEVLGG